MCFFVALEASHMTDQSLQLQSAHLLIILQLRNITIAIAVTIGITVYCTDGPTYNSIYTYQPSNMSAISHENPRAAVSLQCPQ